jgi:DNA-binding NtrC family response regulator
LLDNLEVLMSNFVTLLVEDDASQREAFAALLKDEGFEVIECTTAEDAELIIASTGTELQALITDHNPPGAMSGAELAQYARRRYPNMNVVIISGTTVEPIPVNTTFLQKPFTAEQLLEAARD